jgi:hypothetical protein
MHANFDQTLQQPKGLIKKVIIKQFHQEEMYGIT